MKERESVQVSVQVDADSEAELQQYLPAENLNLAELHGYCHSLLEQLFYQLAKDEPFRELLLAEDLLPNENFWQGWQINLLLCSDSRIAMWNRQFRGQAGATDILSFALTEPPAKPLGGDLLLSLNSWQDNCREFGCEPNAELQRLLLHGLLHLTGLDHYADESPQAPRSPMLQYQETFLRQQKQRIQRQ